jgi:hypothetical protein
MPRRRSNRRHPRVAVALVADQVVGPLAGRPRPAGRGTQIASKTGLSWLLSCRWPGVSTTLNGRPRPSQPRWTLVVSPPRERPSASVWLRTMAPASMPWTAVQGLARDLPETALHVTSRRPTPRSPTPPSTCAVVWAWRARPGRVNPRCIDGKDRVAGSIPAGGSSTNQQVRLGPATDLSRGQEPATAFAREFASPTCALSRDASPVKATPRRPWRQLI